MARSRGDLWPSALLKWLSRKYKALRTVCQGSFQAVLTTGLGDNTFKTLSFFLTAVPLGLLLSLGTWQSRRLSL